MFETDKVGTTTDMTSSSSIETPSSYDQLTKDNLEKLVCQFESQLNQLEKDAKSVRQVDYVWQFFRNRFFDIRRDDTLLQSAIRLNHESTCPIRCVHGKIAYWERKRNPCRDYECELDDTHFCKVHNWCHCDVECECYEICSAHTFATDDFILKNGVKQLIYEDPSKKEFSDFWYGTVKPVDPVNDPYMLRCRTLEFTQSGIFNLTLSLNSIPILEKNIYRLSKELVRQESQRWCMANIRALRFLNSLWYVPNSFGTLVEFHVPNHIIVVLFYYASF